METKLCPKCGETKPLSEYYSCKSKKVASYCNKCFKEYKKEYHKKNSKKYSRVRYEKKKKRKKEIRRLIYEYKKDKPCVDCNEIHPPWAMDFDHIDPSEKEFNISNAARSELSWETILKEIEKCDLVCALCHRYRTHGQKREVAQSGSAPALEMKK